MKRNLRRKPICVWHYVDNARIDGAPSGVWGDLSGVRGDLSGVWGNLSDCAISDDDRERGIDVEDLIAADSEIAALSKAD